jgi:aminopeptidase YwaD
MKELFEGQRVYRTIQYLSQTLGSRVSGSETCRIAGDFIRSQFESYGLKVYEQEFDVVYGRKASHQIEILDSDIGTIDVEPVLLTPDTSNDGFLGDLIYVEGTCPPHDVDITGKIVLWSNTNSHGYTGHHDLLKYKPRAILKVMSHPGIPPRHDQELQKKPPYALVPTFWIGWMDALKVVQAGSKSVRIIFQSESYPGRGRNIVGELQGTHFPDEIVVIGGHYDSPPDVPGASDNASGIAMVMELARVYSKIGSKRTMRFVAWDAEEGGYVGSHHYVKDLFDRDEKQRQNSTFIAERTPTDLSKHFLYINFDVIGTYLGHNSCYVLGPLEIKNSIHTLSSELGIEQDVKYGFYGSDHEMFALAGIPAVSFDREGPPALFIHTGVDDIQLIDRQQLQQLGAFANTFIQRTAVDSYYWPFPRCIPTDQLNDIREKLRGANYYLGKPD